MEGVMTAVLVVVGIVILGFVLSIGASVVTTQQTSQLTGAAGCNSTNVASCGYAYNASVQALTGINTFATQVPSIANIGVLVVILILLLGGVLGFFYLKNKFD